MPFKSKAQVGKFKTMVKSGEITKATYNKWVKHTPSMKSLPKKKKK